MISFLWKLRLSLDITKLINVWTDMNDSKTKIDDLDVGKLKTIPINVKKLSAVVSRKVVKKTVQRTKY